MRIVKYFVLAFSGGFAIILGTAVYAYYELVVIDSLPVVSSPNISIKSKVPKIGYEDLLYFHKGSKEPIFITASHYGCEDSFNLGPRSDGGVFNKKELTTAHISLPFGTKIRLAVPNVNAFIWRDVVVNDGGPYSLSALEYGSLRPHPTRQFDVSCEVAKQLDFYKDGTAQLYVLRIPGEPTLERKDLYSENVLESFNRFTYQGAE